MNRRFNRQSKLYILNNFEILSKKKKKKCNDLISLL